tara:strand:+ start:2570 stop:3025 length:456 start_codon:yes stop_codon:yes gene_type:complete
MKKLIFFIFIFIIGCSANKLSNYHGNKSLETKYDKIIINKTNKNDLIKMIGQPSTISDFDNNKWFFVERLKKNQSLLKLGKQKIKKNNILIAIFNDKGILVSKNLLNIENMNDLKHFEKITQKEFQKDDLIYNIFTSLREKINAPARQRSK